jgi:pimeloyl-ACP methyl ester carboxylesterase
MLEFGVLVKIDCVISLARLSFALSTSKIKEKARVVAMDLRGHGKTSTENELDLSVEVLVILLFFNPCESDCSIVMYASCRVL